VAVEALLRRLVVVRAHHEGAVGARALGVLREVDGFRGGVGAGARDHGDALARGLHHELHEAPVLVVAERGRLPRGAAGDEAVRAGGDVHLHQLAHLGLVDLAVLERRDHRDERAGKGRAHTVVSPATRSSKVSRRRTMV
jgi:hypothetical protein